VLHGNRNKVSPRRVPEGVRKKVIELAMGKDQDINDTHLCEILGKAERIALAACRTCRLIPDEARISES